MTVLYKNTQQKTGRNDRHSQLTEISYYWMMQYPKSGGLSCKNNPCTVQPFLKAFLTLSLTY